MRTYKKGIKELTIKDGIATLTVTNTYGVFTTCFRKEHLGKFDYRSVSVTGNTDPKNRYFRARCSKTRKIHRLQRLIKDCPEDMVVDHIDGNTFNNMDWNLDVVTVAENNRRSAMKKLLRKNQENVTHG